MAGSGQGLGILYFHRVGMCLAQGTRLPPTHYPGIQLASSAGPVRSEKATGLGPSTAPRSLTSCPFFRSQPESPFLKGAPRHLRPVKYSNYMSQTTRSTLSWTTYVHTYREVI